MDVVGRFLPSIILWAPNSKDPVFSLFYSGATAAAGLFNFLAYYLDADENEFIAVFPKQGIYLKVTTINLAISIVCFIISYNCYDSSSYTKWVNWHANCHLHCREIL